MVLGGTKTLFSGIGISLQARRGSADFYSRSAPPATEWSTYFVYRSGYSVAEVNALDTRGGEVSVSVC